MKIRFFAKGAERGGYNAEFQSLFGMADVWYVIRKTQQIGRVPRIEIRKFSKADDLLVDALYYAERFMHDDDIWVVDESWPGLPN